MFCLQTHRTEGFKAQGELTEKHGEVSEETSGERVRSVLRDAVDGDNNDKYDDGDGSIVVVMVATARVRETESMVK